MNLVTISFLLALFNSLFAGSDVASDVATGEPAAMLPASHVVVSSKSLPVRIERIPASNVLILETTGSYDEDPQALNQLLTYASENYVPVGNAFGIYPIDPDSVGMPFARVQQESESLTANPTNVERLKWEVGIRIAPGEPGSIRFERPDVNDLFSVPATENDLTAPISSFKPVAVPFAIRRIPAMNAAVLESDVASSLKDGIDLYSRVVANGYVQVGPTRMEMAMNSDDPAKVRVKIIVPVEKRGSIRVK